MVPEYRRAIRICRRIGLALLVGASFTIAACAPRTAVTTSRALDYPSHPTRLFVIMPAGLGWGLDFSATFRAKFIQLARVCGAEVAFEEVTGLELDPRASVGKVSAFRADAVITIAQAGGVIGAGGNRLSASYSTTMHDLAQDRNVWRGAFVFGRGGTSIPLTERGAVFAIDVTNSLKKDQLLVGCSPVAVERGGRLDAAAIPKGRQLTVTPSSAVPARAAAGDAATGKPSLRDLQDLLPTE